MTNDFTRMAKRIRRLPKLIRQAVNTNIESVMREAATLARAELRKSGSVATRKLLVSTDYKRGANLTSVARSGVRGRTYGTHVVRADAPYAPFVEYGTGSRQVGSPDGQQFRSPSVPPTGAIYSWLVVKGETPRGDYDLLEAARRIAVSVSQHGQRPHPFMRPAWNEVGGVTRIQREHSSGVRSALRRM